MSKLSQWLQKEQERKQQHMYYTPQLWHRTWS